jgi:hypothetical protein
LRGLDARSTRQMVSQQLARVRRPVDRRAPLERCGRLARVEENSAADRIELSAQQIEWLNNLTPAAGERHDEGNMAVIDR